MAGVGCFSLRPVTRLRFYCPADSVLIPTGQVLTVASSTMADGRQASMAVNPLKQYLCLLTASGAQSALFVTHECLPPHCT